LTGDSQKKTPLTVLPPTANAFPSAKNALLSFEKPQKIVKNHVQNTTVVKIRNLKIPFRNRDCTVKKHQKIPIFLYRSQPILFRRGASPPRPQGIKMEQNLRAFCI